MLFNRGHEGAACSCTGTQPTLLTESTSPQAADYDLDGTLDLLVLCNSNAVILTQTADGSWVHMPGAYGDLNDPGRSKADDNWLIWCCSNYDACTAASSIRAFHLEPMCQMVDSAWPVGNRWFGLTSFDIDNDGFVDLMPCNTKCRLYRNSGGNGNSYIAFRLVGSASNEYGIGATALLTWRPEPGAAPKQQMREVNRASAGDPRGSADHRLVFGLGPSGVPLRLEAQQHTTDTDADPVEPRQREARTVNRCAGHRARWMSSTRQRRWPPEQTQCRTPLFGCRSRRSWVRPREPAPAQSAEEQAVSALSGAQWYCAVRKCEQKEF